jgi:two-component system, NtrC family, response regulator AtoC
VLRRNTSSHRELAAGVLVDDPLSSIGLVVGRSQAMRDIAAQVSQVAAYPDTTVLLQGESGTGKDVVAHAIHTLSRRSAYPFVDINCTALPDTLMETELFGVEAGAFTDARVSREGYLLRADGGTLFLDEIGSMPLTLQSKLLRFLETRSFRRVGSTREMHVNLRVISATNVDLATAIARRAFRNDLYYRLQVITLRLPSLRERPEDIEPLVAHFLRQFSLDEAEPLRISDEAMELVMRYDWPGNVRELHSAIKHGQIVCDDQMILPSDLPGAIRASNTGVAQRLAELQNDIHLPPNGVNLPAFLSEIERRLVQEAIEHCHGNQVQAAALLGLSRDQLRYRIARL